MRLQTLTASLLASITLATPIRRDVSAELYTLRLATPYTPLNGLYLHALTPAQNATAGIALGVTPSTQGGDDSAAVVVYPVANPASGLAELHTPDGGALVLVGRHGLLDLASVVGDPAAAPVPDGVTIDWTSFKLADDDGAGSLGFAGGVGRWVAFPSAPAKSGDPQAWGVKFKDSTAATTENYVPVTILYEPLKKE
ncbi:hypothetical protein VTJ49DRAFT_4788 [Mycothermus thermophilus]|uniref:Uncharacterized protein n=1 Tax=Humicola insolens TaxID=85995 RepID=A0ABR3V4L2_HUMIN